MEENINKSLSEAEEGKSPEKDAYFRDFFCSNYAPIVIWDSQTQLIEDANPAAVEFYGWSLEVMKCMKWKDIQLSDWAVERDGAVDQKLDLRDRFLFKHRNARGVIKDVEVFSGTVHLSEKIFQYALVHDVSLQKKMEADLVERERKFRNFFHYAPLGIFCVDLNGKVTDYNQTLRKILFLSEEDDLDTLNVFKTPLFIQSGISDQFRWCLDKPVSISSNHHYIARNGDQKIFLIHYKTITDEFGRISGVQAMVEDRTLADQAEEKYQRLFNNMVNAFALHELILDDYGVPCDYRFLEVNSVFERMTGLEARNIIGKSVKEVLKGIENFWIDVYSQVVFSGESVHFIRYCAPLDKYFELTAYKTSALQFAVIFNDVTRQKNEEEEKNKFVYLVKQSTDFIGLTDLEGKGVYLNPAGRVMVGLSEEDDIRNFSILDFMTDERKKLYEGQNVISVLLEKGGYEAENFTLRNYKTGSEIPIYVNVYPIRNMRNEITHSAILIRDKRSEINLEQALREKEQKYRNIFDYSKDAIFLSMLPEEGEIKGRVFDVNKEACRLLGYSREEMFNKGLMDVALSEEYDEMRDRMISQLRKTKSVHFEISMVTKNNQIFPAEVNSRLIEMDGREYCLSFFRDISERKKMENLLRESVKKYSILVDSLFDGVVMVDAEGTLRFINAQFRKIMGYEEKDLLGFKYTLFIPDVYHPIMQTDLENREEGTYHQYECELVRKNGSRVPVSISASPLYSDDKEFQGTLASIHDMTEIKKVREEMLKQQQALEETIKSRTEELRESLKCLEHSNLRILQSQKQKTRFLSSMSHELRTPLNGIMGFIELLKGQFFGPLNDKQKSYVNQIEQCGKIEISLINNLLEIAKIDSGDMNLRLESGDFYQVLESVLQILDTQAKKKNLVIDKSFDPAVPLFKMDLQKLKEIFLNILTSFFGFLKPGGRIRIITGWEEIRIRAEFTIFKEDIEKEEDAVRLSMISADEDLGVDVASGPEIGVLIARRLAELHGGLFTWDAQMSDHFSLILYLPKEAGRMETNQMEDSK